MARPYELLLTSMFTEKENGSGPGGAEERGAEKQAQQVDAAKTHPWRPADTVVHLIGANAWKLL